MPTRNGARGMNAAQQLRAENDRLAAELLQARAENVRPNKKNSGLSPEEKRWKKNRFVKWCKQCLWGARLSSATTTVSSLD